MDTNSLQKAQREQEIMRSLRAPKTLQELADEFGISYWTLHRVIQPLMRESRIIEVPWRRGREKLFIVNGDIDQHGVLQIVTPGGTQTLAQWCAFDVTPNEIEDIAGVLSQVWRYSAFQADASQAHLAGSMTPVECKVKLRGSLEFIERLRMALEQMLLADIWEEATPDNAQKFGEVDLQRALKNGEAFERRYGK